MSDLNFSYELYKEILTTIKGSGRLCDFSEAKEDFIVLRHDIEFSIDRALNMARIEKELGVQASYFVQIGNESYNPFSDRSKAILREICSYGHKMGLHYRWGKEPGTEIMEQAWFLERQLGVPVDRYSVHRPKREQPYEKHFVPGLINAYEGRFFEKTDHPETAGVKYISDSRFSWRFGFPDENTLKAFRRVQILVHPFQWGSGEPRNAFLQMLNESAKRAEKNFENEFTDYRRIKHGGQCEEMAIQAEHDQYRNRTGLQ